MPPTPWCRKSPQRTKSATRSQPTARPALRRFRCSDCLLPEPSYFPSGVADGRRRAEQQSPASQGRGDPNHSQIPSSQHSHQEILHLALTLFGDHCWPEGGRPRHRPISRCPWRTCEPEPRPALRTQQSATRRRSCWRPRRPPVQTAPRSRSSSYPRRGRLTPKPRAAAASLYLRFASSRSAGLADRKLAAASVKAFCFSS